MKKFFLLFFLIIPFFLTHAHEKDLFVSANQLYHKGLFQEALNTYEKIEKKGPAVWFNMGLCSYHAGNSIAARKYWRRVQLMLHPDLYGACENALTLLEQTTPSESITSSLQKLFDYIVQYTVRYEIFVWQFLFLIIWTLLMLLLAINIRYRKTMLCLLSLLIFFLIIILYAHNYIINHDIGIIEEETPLYIGPNTTFAHNSVLPKGTEVTIIKQSNSWYKIQHHHKTGWLAKTTATRLQEMT